MSSKDSAPSRPVAWPPRFATGRMVWWRRVSTPEEYERALTTIRRAFVVGYAIAVPCAVLTWITPSPVRSFTLAAGLLALYLVMEVSIGLARLSKPVLGAWIVLWFVLFMSLMVRIATIL